MAAFNVPIPPESSQSPYHDLISNMLKAYQTTRYGFPKEEEELEKSRIENKYLPKEKESSIREKESLAGLHGAQAEQANLYTQFLKNRLKKGAENESGNESENNLYNTNSTYGVQKPSLTNDDIINEKVFGTNTYKSKEEIYNNQVKDQYIKNNQALTNAISESNAANDLNQAIAVFNNAMDRSFYRGSTLGNLPSSGLSTFLIPGNLSPEQEADRASVQMLPSAISTLKNAMGSARFSNLDMNMSTKLKFDRTMNDETRELQTAWIGAVNDRMKERSKFLQALKNPNNGLLETDKQMLWTEYQNNFPLIGKDSKGNDSVLKKNLGNWPLYTTPKAMKSIKENGYYVPTEAEKNSFMMALPNGKIVPIKKGKVESALRKGARLL